MLEIVQFQSPFANTTDAQDLGNRLLIAAMDQFLNMAIPNMASRKDVNVVWKRPVWLPTFRKVNRPARPINGDISRRQSFKLLRQEDDSAGTGATYVNNVTR